MKILFGWDHAVTQVQSVGFAWLKNRLISQIPECTEWSIVGYGAGALWDLWIRSIDMVWKVLKCKGFDILLSVCLLYIICYMHKNRHINYWTVISKVEGYWCPVLLKVHAWWQHALETYITGPLWGESTGPLTKVPVMMVLSYLIYFVQNDTYINYTTVVTMGDAGMRVCFNIR